MRDAELHVTVKCVWREIVGCASMNEYFRILYTAGGATDAEKELRRDSRLKFHASAHFYSNRQESDWEAPLKGDTRTRTVDGSFIKI